MKPWRFLSTHITAESGSRILNFMLKCNPMIGDHLIRDISAVEGEGP